MLNEAVIVSAVRTPIGNFMGGLSSLSAQELGSIVISAALDRAGLAPNQVEEVLMGNVLQGGAGQNPARQAAIHAGFANTIPATTINKVCGSGLKAIMFAAQAIRAGDNDIIVAGGMESMSRAPYVLQNARVGFRMGEQKMIDSLICDGLWCALTDVHMGITAENIAKMYTITRAEQDEFAAWSQQKTELAQREERFQRELVPVVIPQKKGEPKRIDKDEFPRSGTTIITLSKLRPAFHADGTVTAGNSSGINDGAAALVVMSKAKAETLQLKPLARIASYASVGVDPAYMGLGPIEATQQALQKAKITIHNVDLIEANEAFAAQSIAVSRELGFLKEKLNVNGGAIALGHPIGASGARILVTLLHELINRKLRYGLATLCIGGGQGVAMIVERI